MVAAASGQLTLRGAGSCRRGGARWACSPRSPGVVPRRKRRGLSLSTTSLTFTVALPLLPFNGLTLVVGGGPLLQGGQELRGGHGSDLVFLDEVQIVLGRVSGQQGLEVDVFA